MSFKAESVVFSGGIRVTGSSAQVAPQGSVSATYDPRSNGLTVAHSITDGNGIVPSPNHKGVNKLVHYLAEYALTNPYNRQQIAGWRALGQLEEGLNSVPQEWAGQQIRINGVFRDGLGKNETVYGTTIRLPAQLTTSATTGGTRSPSPSGANTGTAIQQASSTATQAQATPKGSRFSVTTLGNANEGQAVVFQVERTGLINEIATVQVETMNDSARMGSDYVGKTENVWFGAGESKKLIHISTLGDSLKEGTEHFTLNLRVFNTSHSLATGQSTARASIFNVDPVTGQPSNPTIIPATAGTDRLSGSSGRDVFQMAASPSVMVTTFRPDSIVNFDPQQGDKIQLSRSAYRLKPGSVSFAQARDDSEQQKALNNGTSVVYNQASGLWSVNSKATIDGSEGPILQLLNKPFLNNINNIIETI